MIYIQILTGIAIVLYGFMIYKTLMVMQDIENIEAYLMELKRNDKTR